jgi:hypothetical protein
MDFDHWDPLYQQILDDMGYDRESDENSVRILKAVTMGSDLQSGDDAAEMLKQTATVVGNAPCLEDDIRSKGVSGTILCSGSAVGRLVAMGYEPDMVFTDLDGDIEPQIEASRRGAFTFIHAHGDNADLIIRYAPLFKGPVVLTTQTVPEYTVFNYGGFTDGDRAVCFAAHFGVQDIRLVGFDYDNPMPKEGSDPLVKKRKLQWARRIVDSLTHKC